MTTTAIQFLRRFAKDNSGATAIEYGIIASGIMVAIVIVVYEIGPVIADIFTDVKNGL